MSVSQRLLSVFRGPGRLAAGLGILLLGLGAEGGAQPPRDGKLETVRGVVQRFTTAPKGDVDGAILDDGTWVHWPPHLADRMTALIAKKDRIRATGWRETDPEGRRKFEARSVTNLTTEETASFGDDGPKGPKG